MKQARHRGAKSRAGEGAAHFQVWIVHLEREWLFAFRTWGPLWPRLARREPSDNATRSLHD